MRGSYVLLPLSRRTTVSGVAICPCRKEARIVSRRQGTIDGDPINDPIRLLNPYSSARRRRLQARLTIVGANARQRKVKQRLRRPDFPERHPGRAVVERLMSNRPKRRAWMLAVASGLLATLALPPFALSSLHWVAFVPMLLAARMARGLRSGFVLGALGTMPMFVGATYGLIAFRSEAAVVPVIQTLGAAALVAAYGALSRRRGDGMLAGFAFAGAWILFEYVTTANGMPWCLALTQSSNLRMIQIASLFGMSAVSFAILLSNVGVAETLYRGVRGDELRRALRPILGVTIFLGLLAGYGEWSLRAVGDAEGIVPVAVVQPALPSELYTYQWLNPGYRHEVRSVVSALSARAAATEPGLLVWPENGNGQFNFRVPALRAAVAELALQSRATLLLSSYDQDSLGQTFNAVFSVGPDGTILGRYAKLRLAPGGEEGFVPGTELVPLATRFGTVGALVCLESTLAWMARDLVRQGAQLLLVTTSDASMRNSVAPVLHARYSVFRAIENRRWLVQASNAGPSWIIDPVGRVRAESPLSVRTALHAAVSFTDRLALYARFGDTPILLLALVATCLGVSIGARREAQSAQGVSPTWSPVGPSDGAVGVIVSCGVSVVTVVASLGILSGASIRGWGDAAHAFVRPALLSVPPDVERPVRSRSANEAALAYALGLLGIDVAARNDGAALTLSLTELAEIAKSFGVMSWTERHDREGLAQLPKPVLADLGDRAVVVLASSASAVDVFDPLVGLQRLLPAEFARRWTGDVLTVRFAPLHGLDQESTGDATSSVSDDYKRG